MSDGWTERVAVGVGIGAKDGQQKEAGGLLASITHDVGENHSTMYELVQQNGDSLNVWGSTSIDNKIRPSDIGQFIKIQFKGMATGKSGRQYKDITVDFFTGEKTDVHTNWPRYNELQNGVPVTNEKSDYAEFPEALKSEEEEDSLPF